MLREDHFKIAKELFELFKFETFTYRTCSERIGRSLDVSEMKALAAFGLLKCNGSKYKCFFFIKDPNIDPLIAERIKLIGEIKKIESELYYCEKWTVAEDRKKAKMDELTSQLLSLGNETAVVR